MMDASALRLRLIGLVLLVALVALVLPGAPRAVAADEAAVQSTSRPGPIPRDFDGMAYPVPDSSVPDGVVDTLPVTLVSREGDVVGSSTLPAGKSVRVRPLEGDPNRVAIRWTRGPKRARTALAPRANFWAMPGFIRLGDMQVEVDGERRPLGSAGIRYHRVNANYFDDPATPDFDGTLPLNRDFLACKRDTWGIGQQTFAVDPIEEGVHRRDKTLIDKGIRALAWGEAVPINDAGIHELHRECDGATTADFGYTHHTTQWLEAMGRASYLLAASPWAGEYRATIDATIARIEEVAALETRPDNYDHWVDEIKDSYGNDFTHRAFMMAAALGLASTLTDDRAAARNWERHARSIAKRAIDNQWRSGVNPERGGYDVQYQMYGTWLGVLYLSTLRPEDPQREDMVRTIDRAVQWMTGRIKPNGTIRIRGTTRVCVEDLWSVGAPAPKVDPAETVRTFLLWGHLTSDPDLVKLAVRIDQGDKRFGNVCPADYVAKPEQFAEKKEPRP